jgi:hypothetical protein
MENHELSSKAMHDSESTEIRELSTEEMLILAGGAFKDNTTMTNSEPEPSCHGSCHGGTPDISN